MSLGFGHVARIGHLYPSGGLSDYEIQLMAPEGIQFVTTRLPFRSTDIRGDRCLVKDLESHARLLADADVNMIAVNCTAATLLAGPDRINERVREATGINSLTTIEAVVAAINVIGISRPALLTPYPNEVVEAEQTFLRSHGIEIVTHREIPCATPVEQARIEPRRWFDLAGSLDTSGIDGVLFSCAGIRIASKLQAIEQCLGVPVVASNQALLWYLLRTLNSPSTPCEYGALLSGQFRSEIS